MPEGVQFEFANQPEPLGLGHAVWCAKEIVGDEPFAVLLPDDLVQAEPGCLARMIERYGETGGSLLAVEHVPPDRTDRYGILDLGAKETVPGELVDVRGLVEKPSPAEAPSTLAVIGRYILQPEIFAALEGGAPGAGGEIQLTDGIAALIGRQAVLGYRIEGERFDCGDRQGWLTANVAFALHRPDFAGIAERLLALLDPADRRNQTGGAA